MSGPGATKREYLQSLNDAYAIDAVVERESGDCGIICLPDFTIMPPDGKLVTGKTAEGGVEVGVDVPELTVRSCFVAAGRLMANDVPDYLRRKLQHAKKDATSMRTDLPGVGIDLSINPFLGETDLPTDHFLNDGLMGDLLSPICRFWPSRMFRAGRRSCPCRALCAGCTGKTATSPTVTCTCSARRSI